VDHLDKGGSKGKRKRALKQVKKLLRKGKDQDGGSSRKIGKSTYRRQIGQGLTKLILGGGKRALGGRRALVRRGAGLRLFEIFGK